MYKSQLAKALHQVMEDECKRYRKMSEKSVHIFSENFEISMKKLISRANKPYFPLINTGFKRAAACVMIVIMTFFGGMATINGGRNSFNNFSILTNTDGMAKIRTYANSGFPTTINETYEVTYNLTDYEVIYELSEESIINLDYKNSNGDTIFFKQITYDYFNKIWWDIKDDTISSSDIHGNEAICFADGNGINTVMWSNSMYVFTISTSLSMDEAIEIAKSVKGGENNA